MRNPIDLLVSVVSPEKGLRRLQARVNLRSALERTRAYDAAAKGRRLGGWRTSSKSPSAETEFSLSSLRDRSRDLVRNNQWAGEAVRIWKRNAIGPGFGLRVQGPTRAAKRARELWDTWAGTESRPSTEIDPENRKTFAGLQALGMREVVEAGEFLIRRRWRRADDNLTVPLQLELLEPDHLDTTRTLVGTKADKARIIQGVQYSSRGRIQGYWLFRDHPGDNRAMRRESVFVPARDVIHVFAADRIGQVRGVPWGASCILKLRDLDLFDDAELQRKQIASMFVGFVHDMEAGFVDSLVNKPGGSVLEMEGGTFEDLAPGKTINFSTPPTVEGYRDYMSVGLHAIAKGYSVTYEDLTGDLSGVNFSSARIGRMTHVDGVRDWQNHTWKPAVLARVWGWFLEAAFVVGKITRRDLIAEWTAPPPRLADPKTEVTTASLRVRAGFSSLSGVIRELGRNPEEVLAELSDDMKLLDSLGLVVDSDARQATSSGADRDDLAEASTTGGAPAEETDGPDLAEPEPFESRAASNGRGVVEVSKDLLGLRDS